MKNKDKLSADYWRSLEQLSDTPEFNKFLQREFPQEASQLKDPVSRRKFLSLVGASLAFAGLASCRRPVEKIIPYVTAPENVIPGIAKYYATTMTSGLNAYGLLVESHEGRPTKIEGNPQHPSSLGKSNAFMQAEILQLYDPDRSTMVRYNNAEKSWSDFIDYWREEYSRHKSMSGKGLAVLSGSSSSPSVKRLQNELLSVFPETAWYAYEPVADDNRHQGLRLATGQEIQPVYDYTKARVILSLDADILLLEGENLTSNTGFASGRKVYSESDEMNRLYVVESNYSVTGAAADHRMKLQSLKIRAFTTLLAQELKNAGLKIDLPADLLECTLDSLDQLWLKTVAKDLLENKAQSVVVAGRNQPAEVHALVYLINEALGNNSSTVRYFGLTDSIVASQKSLSNLAADIRNNKIDTLFVLDGDPLFHAPADLKLTDLFKKIDHTIHLSSIFNETSAQCSWHVPKTHFLEAWGDAVSVNGTKSIVQPLIAPLHGGHSQLELLALMASGLEKSGYDIVKETWQKFIPKKSFEDSWEKILHDGVFQSESDDDVKTKLAAKSLAKLLEENPVHDTYASAEILEVVFYPSATVYDGTYANNGWMQELPDPITKITWGNTAIISSRTAEDMDLASGDVVSVIMNGRSIELPVYVLPGQADYSIALNLGYGHNRTGKIADNVGENVSLLRTAEAPWIVLGAKIEATGKSVALAGTQDHGSMEHRPLIREATLSEYRDHPKFAQEMVEHPPLESLWEEHSYTEGNQWGMTIDLSACTGCNACVIACQSENNIPVVGKEQVIDGREMHWLRMDRYFNGDTDDPEIAFQPVACQHCENAPCEQVCPVQATLHDDEGLNVMTYNRCIGTRYCSNNCPYKVRRFNFFSYTNGLTETIKMAQNPDVTVRSRGVMEKCTFCIQRINSGKQTAKLEGRDVQDGEVVTACQQSCPADAISFGNINDPQSAVSGFKKQDRNYTMLGELNLKTRNTYLAKIRNPHPDLQKNVNS